MALINQNPNEKISDLTIWSMRILYYMLYPFAYLVYTIMQVPIQQYAIDFVTATQKNGVYWTMNLISYVETAANGVKFSSNVCMSNKNMFGMKHPSVRQTLSKGTQNGHAFYASYFDSAMDWIMYLNAGIATPLRNTINLNLQNSAANVASFSTTVAGILGQIGYFQTAGGYTNPNTYLAIFNRKDTRPYVWYSLILAVLAIIGLIYAIKDKVKKWWKKLFR